MKNTDANWLSQRTHVTLSEDEVHGMCNGILSQEQPKLGVININQIQTVDWWKWQQADESLKLIPRYVEQGKKSPFKSRSGLPEEAKLLLHDI